MSGEGTFTNDLKGVIQSHTEKFEGAGMNKMSRVKWQGLEDAFLSGDLDDAKFCKSKNLNLEWFRQELSKSELQETPGRKAGVNGL